MSTYNHLTVFETQRLVVRLATSEDAEMFLALWSSPAVMANVGFPNGLPITLEEIEQQLQAQAGPSLGRMLVIQIKATREVNEYHRFQALISELTALNQRICHLRPAEPHEAGWTEEGKKRLQLFIKKSRERSRRFSK